MATVPRKRARVDSSPRSEALANPVAAEEITRDEKHYFDDGDFVIRAGSKLFRIHRFMLSRDSSMFKDMFVVAGGSDAEAAPDGLTDETALVVTDSVEAFRALLWVLYALASDVSNYQSKVKNMNDLDWLLLVAEITNKYQFTSLENWSLQTIKAVVPKLKFTEATCPLLVRVMTLARRIADHELIGDVVDCMEELLKGGANPARLIVALEGEGHPRLSALAYYAQLQCSLPLGGQGSENPAIFAACEELNTLHLTRLSFGHWSLHRTVWQLAQHPPLLPQEVSCLTENHAKCKEQWLAMWKDAINSQEPVSYFHSIDLLGRLESALAHLSSSRVRKKLIGCCRAHGEEAVLGLLAKKSVALQDHFQLPSIFSEQYGL
ncbi:BTB domain-containing protein [Favolaschia claudopus]|uniref:BTB domain-containing protein n=1 Tax=Favolaschia claudopus TaxID=2862362 RepID=A0AAW0AWZ7_9AGAR